MGAEELAVLRQFVDEKESSLADAVRDGLRLLYQAVDRGEIIYDADLTRDERLYPVPSEVGGKNW
jgi:hypothetical protein